MLVVKNILIIYGLKLVTYWLTNHKIKILIIYVRK